MAAEKAISRGITPIMMGLTADNYAGCRICRRAQARHIPCPEAGQTSSSEGSSLER